MRLQSVTVGPVTVRCRPARYQRHIPLQIEEPAITN